MIYLGDDQVPLVALLLASVACGTLKARASFSSAGRRTIEWMVANAAGCAWPARNPVNKSRAHPRLLLSSHAVRQTRGVQDCPASADRNGRVGARRGVIAEAFACSCWGVRTLGAPGR